MEKTNIITREDSWVNIQESIKENSPSLEKGVKAEKQNVQNVVQGHEWEPVLKFNGKETLAWFLPRSSSENVLFKVRIFNTDGTEEKLEIKTPKDKEELFKKVNSIAREHRNKQDSKREEQAQRENKAKKE